jgi:hypothetical protein
MKILDMLHRATTPRLLSALVCLALLSGCSSGPAPSQSSLSLFREVSEETGLRFQHFTGATGDWALPEIMGSGVALFDYDNDGDLDVFLVQSDLVDKSKRLTDALFPPPPGWKPGYRLFRNELLPSGKLQFTDVTGQAGVGQIGYGMGAAVGDYDNDGYQDLYVTNFGRNISITTTATELSPTSRARQASARPGGPAVRPSSTTTATASST